MSLKIFEIVFGVICIIAALTYGIIRLVKVPQRLNFTRSAMIRYAIFMLIALMGGVALFTAGLIR